MKKITKAKIVPPKDFGKTSVVATFDDGTEETVIEYYHDELSFTAKEFIGLTEEEAGQLHFKKDKAYLQS